MKKLQLLYESSYNKLLRLGSLRGNSEEDTKDAINQTFLDFAEKKIDFEIMENPEGYILISFQRKLVDGYRIKKRDSELSANVSKGRVIDMNTLEKLEIQESESEFSNQLYLAYKNLPERCQKIIYLKYLSGLSNENISKITGLSKRSVYNNLSVGIKLLRQNMKPKKYYKHNLNIFLLIAFVCIILS